MNFAIAFWIGMTVGALCEALIACFYHLLTRKPFVAHPRFGNANKFALISLPIWGVIGLLASQNYNYVLFFFIVAVVGTVLEMSFGFMFKRLFGVTLWEYHRGKITQYTSWYSIPYWGGASLVFLSLAKWVGLQL